MACMKHPSSVSHTRQDVYLPSQLCALQLHLVAAHSAIQCKGALEGTAVGASEGRRGRGGREGEKRGEGEWRGWRRGEE